MIVLDTNVVSELMRAEPSESVMEWVDGQIAAELFLSAVTAAELLYGIARLPDGRRKQDFVRQIELMFEEDFDNRVIPSISLECTSVLEERPAPSPNAMSSDRSCS